MLLLPRILQILCSVVALSIAFVIWQPSRLLAQDGRLPQIDKQVLSLVHAGNTQDALALSIATIEAARKSRKPIDEAAALVLTGKVLAATAEYARSLEYYTTALQLLETTPSAPASSVASILETISVTLDILGRRVEAQAAGQRALSIRLRSYREGNCEITRTALDQEPAVDCDISGTVWNTRPSAIEFKEQIDAVSVFFGTDRKRTDIALPSNLTRVAFGSERGHALTLGRSVVSIPRDHTISRIERPWRLTLAGVTFYSRAEDPKQHFVIASISTLNQRQFVGEIRKQVAGGDRFNKQALVFIHGYNVGFDDALFRTAQIAYDLKFDGGTFLYSWPSAASTVDYNLDLNSSRQAERYFEQFLSLILDQTGAERVHIIAHSMGNSLLLGVLQKFYRTARDPRIAEVILAAPDVDRDLFKQVVTELSSSVKRLTLYVSSRDRAMHASRFWNGAPRAGDQPPDGPIIIRGVDTIDTSGINTDIWALNHSSYGDSPWLINDIASLLKSGIRPPGDRTPILRQVQSSGGDFWRFPPIE